MAVDEVFLLDVDNTLLDADRIAGDLHEHFSGGSASHVSTATGQSSTSCARS